MVVDNGLGLKGGAVSNGGSSVAPLLPQMNLLAGQTDSFTRASPVANAVWTATFDGGMTIVSNQASGVAASRAGDFRSDTAHFPSNQYSRIQLPASLIAGDYVGVSVRNQNSQNNYTAIYFNNAGTYQIALYTKVANTYTQVVSNNCGQVAAGTNLTIIAEGAVIQAYVGSAPNTTNGCLAIRDTTFLSGGTPGIESFGASALASNWSGGQAATGPFTSTIATDSFTRANGLVSAGQPNWTDLTATFSGVACSGASIASNEVSLPAAQHYADYRNEVYSNDQWAQFGRGAVAASGQPFIMGMIRWNGTQGYIGGWFGASTPGIQIYQLLANNNSVVIASAVTNAAASNLNSTYAIAAKGSRISAFLNGSEVLALTDTTRTVGQPGLMGFGIASGNNFAAGNT